MPQLLRLELLAASQGRTICTCNGRLFVGKIITKYSKVVAAAVCDFKKFVAAVTKDKEVIILEWLSDGVREVALQ